MKHDSFENSQKRTYLNGEQISVQVHLCIKSVCVGGVGEDVEVVCVWTRGGERSTSTKAAKIGPNNSTSSINDDYEIKYMMTYDAELSSFKDKSSKL